MLFEDAVPIPSQSMDTVFDGKGFNEAGKLAVVMMDGWHSGGHEHNIQKLELLTTKKKFRIIHIQLIILFPREKVTIVN